jgi:hypothetical protein
MLRNASRQKRVHPVNLSNSKTTVRIPAAQFRPSLAKLHPRKTEGAGNAGCTTHPLPCVQTKETHARPTQVRRNHPALPAQWFYGYSVLFLVCRAF